VLDPLRPTPTPTPTPTPVSRRALFMPSMVTTLIIVPELAVPIIIPPMFLVLLPLHVRRPTTTTATGATIVSVPIVPSWRVPLPLPLAVPFPIPISMPMRLPMLPLTVPLSMMSTSVALLTLLITISAPVFVPSRSSLRCPRSRKETKPKSSHEQICGISDDGRTNSARCGWGMWTRTRLWAIDAR